SGISRTFQIKCNPFLDLLQCIVLLLRSPGKKLLMNVSPIHHQQREGSCKCYSKHMYFMLGKVLFWNHNLLTLVFGRLNQKVKPYIYIFLFFFYYTSQFFVQPLVAY
uniref:Uncharacterized protein n=1 Tax=Cairina moschata TaxID=8855 RepID=A0A8C3BLD2_CAIMO